MLMGILSWENQDGSNERNITFVEGLVYAYMIFVRLFEATKSFGRSRHIRKAL
jgi:hypothetical protein